MAKILFWIALAVWGVATFLCFINIAGQHTEAIQYEQKAIIIDSNYIYQYEQKVDSIVKLIAYPKSSWKVIHK